MKRPATRAMPRPIRHIPPAPAPDSARPLMQVMQGTWRLACGLLLGLSALLPLPALAGTSNSLMDVSVDGALLACSNRDAGSVTVIDPRTLTRLREVPVGAKPEGITFLGDSHQLAVACYGDDRVVFLDADSGERLGRLEVFDEPYGLVSSRDGRRLYVTLDFPGDVLEVDVAAREIERQVHAGDFVRGIALSPDGARLFVTEYYTGLVRAIDAASLQIIDEWPGASTDNLARQIVAHPTREKLYLPHIRSRVQAAHGSGSIFPYVTVVNTGSLTGGLARRSRIPMDSFQSVVVTANPWEIAVSPDGQNLIVVFSGTDDMFVCSILNDNYREIALRKRLPTGSNPRAVRVSPDNTRFYVYNALDFRIAAYDLDTLEPLGEVKVCENPLDPQIHRGKVLFYTANPPLTSRRWISCSSCHPDGDADGRTWQNPEGLRNTPPLFGLAWTHPLHWSADRDEVQDFEHTIRGLLMQGRGLVRGPIHASLEGPNRGLSEDLDALAAYTNSHQFSLSPFAKNGLSEAARRGQQIFHSEKTQCTKCHSGPYYTDSRPENDLLRHDVGTGQDDPSELMGPAYDTPTLLGVYRSAPYLHHGQAETLRDVLTTSNRNDRHGTTSHLSEQELDDLVEFLKSLPFESPIPAAKQAGLTKIVD